MGLWVSKDVPGRNSVRKETIHVSGWFTTYLPKTVINICPIQEESAIWRKFFFEVRSWLELSEINRLGFNETKFLKYRPCQFPNKQYDNNTYDDFPIPNTQYDNKIYDDFSIQNVLIKYDDFPIHNRQYIIKLMKISDTQCHNKIYDDFSIHNVIIKYDDFPIHNTQYIIKLMKISDTPMS